MDYKIYNLYGGTLLITGSLEVKEISKTISVSSFTVGVYYVPAVGSKTQTTKLMLVVR